MLLEGYFFLFYIMIKVIVSVTFEVINAQSNFVHANETKKADHKRKKQFERLCQELVKFTPNLCDNKDARMKCNVCKQQASVPGYSTIASLVISAEFRCVSGSV